MQFRKIVVGIDFSDASLAAARWVADYLAQKAELFLVHVVTLPRPPIYLHEQIAPTIDQRSTLAPRLYAALSAFGELLGCHQIRVGVRTGVAWSALARVANEVKADLICVARGDKRKGSSRFGATTPQRLLAVSRMPVLVIPHGAATKPNRVVAALSGRPGGERVLPVAERLASAWGASLEGVHVIEPDVRHVLAASTRLSAVPQYFASSSSENGRRMGIDALDEARLRDLASGWIASTFSTVSPGVPYEGDVRIGDAGQELITTVRDKPGPAVIVLGRAGEDLAGSSQSQYRCGSTTRMVLWAAPCPVFVVPLETPASRALPIDIPTGRLDSRLSARFTDDRAPAMESIRSYSQNGNDAA